MMLKKQHRLNRKAFDAVYERGRNVSTGRLYAKVADTEADYPRLSVVVPKKVAQKAVERNHLRRQGYAALEEYFHLLPTGVGVIIFLRPGAKDISFTELQDELKKLLSKADLI